MSQKQGENQKDPQTPAKNQKCQKYIFTLYSTDPLPKKIALSIRPSTTLAKARTYLNQSDNYLFYFDDAIHGDQSDSVDSISYLNGNVKNITLKINNIEEEIQAKILAKKNQIPKDQFIDMTLIKKEKDVQNKVLVKGALQQTLSQFRNALLIQIQFKFLNSSNQTIAFQVQQDYKMSDIKRKSQNTKDQKPIVIVFKQQTPKEQEAAIAKRDQLQTKRIAQRKQIIQDLNALQNGMLDKDKSQQKVKQIQAFLDKRNMPLTLDVDQKQQLSYIKGIFQKQDSPSRDWTRLADNKDQFWMQLKKNGFILAPYYTNQHLNQTQQLRVIDFQNTKIQYLEDLQKTRRLNIAIFESNASQNSKTELEKLDNYNFTGASVSAGYGPVSVAVQTGIAKISNKQTIQTNKSAKKDERIKQIYYALCINHAITFQPGSIKLKDQVIWQFQALVQRYLNQKLQKTKQEQLSNQTKKQINDFLDKYGDGVENGIYFLGGVYKNTLDYIFTQQKSQQDVQNIMNLQNKLSIKASVSVGFGGFSAGLGTNVQRQSARTTGTAQLKSQQQDGYTCSKAIQTFPLNYIENLGDWLALMQGKRQQWRLIKIQSKQSIPMKQLLNKEINQPNESAYSLQFIQAREQVFNLIDNIQNREYFKFAFDSTILSQGNFYWDRNNIALFNSSQDDSFYSICGDTSFYKDKVHHIQLTIQKGTAFSVFIGVVSSKYRYTEFPSIQDQTTLYQAIVYSIGDQQIIQRNSSQISQINVNPSYSIGDKIVMTVDLISFGISFTYNRVPLNNSMIDIPMIFLKDGLYPFFGLKTQDQVVNLTKNLLNSVLPSSQTKITE